ncbi:unnamed protein product [Coffea canephora]|uniref:DRBM domain-containing protein n=2 Tax=Coffea TaxID=13442 RepID=A0A068U2F5_COFCA|nr:unnamed protein product [Coffea canephora]
MSEPLPLPVADPSSQLPPQQPQPILLPLPPANNTLEPAAQSSNSGAERLMYKNRLQEYTQKSSLQLPVYTTINEGVQHAPRFRATVLVDGMYYTSQGNYPTRKSAEQEAAKIALENIQQKMRDDGCPIIREDTTFCKSILNEYAVKMHQEKPAYNTIQPGGLIPVFVSTLVFNGVSYTGDKGRNKKEAEQLAARAIILSILDSADSASATLMSEIIKSKSKLYAAVNKIRDANSIHSAVNSVNTWEDPGVLLSKGKVAQVGKTTASFPSLAESAKTHATHVPFHPFKKPKLETSTEVVAPPIVFVPPVLGQPLHSSTSGVKRNRKNKKKAKVGVQIGPQIPVAVGPLNQIPSCSVAQ